MIVFDLDGTLSVVGDRAKYLQQNKKDFDAFYGACGEDTVNEPIADIFRTLQPYNHIKIVTGRRESCRFDTLKWLSNNLLFIQDRDLHMRQDGDFRHDTLVKPELVEPFICNIRIVFEDRKSMVDKWRELGITCCQVAEGNF